MVVGFSLSEPESEHEPVCAKAVALKDARDSGSLPRLVASGQGAIAEQMLQIAWANNIKVREDADLVEILSAIDLDTEIPVEAIAAVAEILSYVYRANAGAVSLKDEPNHATDPA